MTQEDLQQLGQLFDKKMDEKLAPLNKRLDGIEQRLGTIEEDQLHVSTALDTLKAWQDDIREKMVTKADFTHLEEKVDATKAEVDTIKKQLRPRHAD